MPFDSQFGKISFGRKVNMKVLLADEYGFCFGVERAVEMVEEAIANGAAVRTLGPLIHNPQEMQRLGSRGCYDHPGTGSDTAGRNGCHPSPRRHT